MYKIEQISRTLLSHRLEFPESQAQSTERCTEPNTAFRNSSRDHRYRRTQAKHIFTNKQISHTFRRPLVATNGLHLVRRIQQGPCSLYSVILQYTNSKQHNSYINDICNSIQTYNKTLISVFPPLNAVEFTCTTAGA